MANALWLRRRLGWWLGGIILLVWIILYLPNLRSNPPWYGDETLSLAIARNVFHGDPTLDAFRLTFWHAYLPYQPAYLWLVGLFSACTGGDILGGRFFNVLIGLFCSWTIFSMGRRLFGTIPSFIGALLCLTYVQAIIHYRWIYPHNMVSLGFALMTLYLMRSYRPKNDWRAGCALALATGSHPIFIYGAAAAVLTRLKSPRSGFISHFGIIMGCRHFPAHANFSPQDT